jgi:putative FmdB family regulatory protein
MPIYEFQCSECGHPFEELVFGASAITQVSCPQCESREVEKKISTFASKIAGGNNFSASSSAASCTTGST